MGYVVGAKLRFTHGEEVRGEGAGLEEVGLVDQEVVGGGNRVVVVEVAVGPAGEGQGAAVVEEGEVVGVDLSIEVGVAVPGVLDEEGGGVDGLTIKEGGRGAGQAEDSGGFGDGEGGEVVRLQGSIIGADAHAVPVAGAR